MRKFRQYQHLYLRHNPRLKNLCYEVKECTRKHIGSELTGLKSAELLDILRARFLVWEESPRTATPEEVKRGTAVDPDTRPLNPSSNSADFDSKKTETCHRDCRLDVGTQWRRKRFQESTNLRDAVRNIAQTRSCAYIYYGDAASFHEWEFHTRLRIAGKHCDQYIEAMSKVVDGPRGVMHTSRQKKSASIVYAKLSMEHLVVSTR